MTTTAHSAQTIRPILASIWGAHQWNLLYALNRRLPFTTSGSLRGELSNGYGPGSGRLEGTDLDQYRADRGNFAYVVMSYATPIAWTTTDGRTHIVEQRFSPTTGRQQSRLYAMGMPVGHFDDMFRSH